MNATASSVALATCWLASAAALAAPPRLPPPSGGELLLNERSFHAGEVAPGTPVRHAFRVRNVGLGPLSIHAQPG